MPKITVQLTPDAPITEIDESLLVKSVGGFEDENERTTWVEYRLASDPHAERAVHRSVDMVLKKPVVFGAAAVNGFS